MNKKDEELLKIVSGNIKEARKVLGISQLELSNRCELSQSYIGEIESCKKMPSLKTINLIAENLNIKPYRLFLDEELKMLTDRDYLYSKLQKEVDGKVSNVIKEIFNGYGRTDTE